MYPLGQYLCIHAGQSNHYINTSVTPSTPALFNLQTQYINYIAPPWSMRVLLFPQATKVIKLILSKLNEMGLQGKSTIPLARLELRIFDTPF